MKGHLRTFMPVCWKCGIHLNYRVSVSSYRSASGRIQTQTGPAGETSYGHPSEPCVRSVPSTEQDPALDGTHVAAVRPPASNAILVTLLVLMTSNVGFAVGIFARLAGHLTLYSSAGVGAGAWATLCTLGLMILAFVRSG